MIHKIARYRVRPEKLAEAHQAITEFVAAVKSLEKDTILYQAYQQRGSFDFFHIMCFSDNASEEAHRNSEHVRKFIAALYPICEEPPHFGDLRLLASNRE
jgi:quinol monooxygenase YgiN